MFSSRGIVLLWRMDFLEKLEVTGVSWSSPSPQDPWVYSTLNPVGILPTQIYPPAPGWEQWGSHGVLAFTRCLAHLYQQKPHKTSLQPGEEHLSYPHLPQDLQPSRDLLSPPPLSRENPGFIERRHLSWLKEAKVQLNAPTQCAQNHKGSQVVTLNVQSTE